jgi:hypothetical protein
MVGYRDSTPVYQRFLERTVLRRLRIKEFLVEFQGTGDIDFIDRRRLVNLPGQERMPEFDNGSSGKLKT